MTNYAFDATNVNVDRANDEAALLGGSARLVTPAAPDGSPGTPYVEVTVPDGTPYASVGAVITNATGVTPEEQDAWHNLLERDGAKEIIDLLRTRLAKVLRAVADVTRDELNVIRGWTRDFKAATAAATSLANLQARVAALPTLGDRTTAQVKSAILSRIDDGTVD